MKNLEAKVLPLDRTTFPVQIVAHYKCSGVVCREVNMAAYEVYCALHGEQDAMIQDGCRGGLSAGELIAFLYARGFPKEQWKARADEAFTRMQNL